MSNETRKCGGNVMGEIIEFKGVSDGVYLNLKSNDMEKIKKEIKEKMDKSADFFKGTNLLGIKNKELSQVERLEIAYFLKLFYDFKLAEKNFDAICGRVDELELEIERLKEEKQTQADSLNGEDDHSIDIDDLISEGMAKFIYGTLRSGQEIKYPGNIVVVGDVNPGGFLKADGNIIVLGKLRGTAYAGLNGNDKAVVAAYDLAPSQLKIGKLIVRAPDDDQSHNRLPEIARVIDDKVVIETYLPNK